MLQSYRSDLKAYLATAESGYSGRLGQAAARIDLP